MSSGVALYREEVGPELNREVTEIILEVGDAVGPAWAPASTSEKTTLVNGDQFAIADSEAANANKKVLWSTVVSYMAAALQSVAAFVLWLKANLQPEDVEDVEPSGGVVTVNTLKTRSRFTCSGAITLAFTTSASYPNRLVHVLEFTLTDTTTFTISGFSAAADSPQSMSALAAGAYRCVLYATDRTFTAGDYVNLQRAAA